MLEVHVNFGSAGEAENVARGAVEKRLAASASVRSPVRSFFWWQQALKEAEEVPVVFRTSESKVHDLMDYIVGQHSYELPGVVVHRPMTANTKYLDWIDTEMRRPRR